MRNLDGGPPEIRASIGANFRRLRLALGDSQIKAAAIAGVSQRIVSNFEKGTLNPTLITLERLASYANVTVPTLLRPPGLTRKTDHRKG